MGRFADLASVSGVAYFLLGDLRCLHAAYWLTVEQGAPVSSGRSAVRPEGVGLPTGHLNLMYSPRGVAFGASYTDIHAQVPAYRLLMIVAVLGAAYRF